MKILLLCYEHPSPSVAGSHRVLYSLEYLSERYQHDITLVAFKLPGEGYPELSRYCRVETINIPHRPGLQSPRATLNALKNLFQRRHSPLNFSYSPEMAVKVKALLNSNRYDILVVDHPAMLPYMPNKEIPTVLLEAFALSEIALMNYHLEKNWFFKIIRRLYYWQMRNYGKRYQALDVAIAVSTHQRDTVKSHCPDLEIAVIPHGIDTDYFIATEPETTSPNLIITGSMGGPRNRAAVLYFYHKIYPLIRAKIPTLKLYIVGSNPGKEIRRLTADESVVVTGYVADLRPYLSRAWVVVAPLLESFGVKVRVLQVMAVGKPVVATSMVATGIDVSPRENIILADEPREFAERVIELLNDKNRRERIGAQARQLMQTEHNWEKLTDRLNEVLEKAATKKLPA